MNANCELFSYLVFFSFLLFKSFQRSKMNYFAHFIRIALKADVFNENISKFPNSLRFTLVSLLLSYKQFNYFF